MNCCSIDQSGFNRAEQMRNVIQGCWRLAQCNTHINAEWHLVDSFRQRLADAVQMAGSASSSPCSSCSHLNAVWRRLPRPLPPASSALPFSWVNVSPTCFGSMFHQLLQLFRSLAPTSTTSPASPIWRPRSPAATRQRCRQEGRLCVLPRWPLHTRLAGAVRIAYRFLAC